MKPWVTLAGVGGMGGRVRGGGVSVLTPGGGGGALGLPRGVDMSMGGRGQGSHGGGKIYRCRVGSRLLLLADRGRVLQPGQHTSTHAVSEQNKPGASETTCSHQLKTQQRINQNQI